MSDRPLPVSGQDPITLVELVNRVVDRGVVLGGDVTISVAEVDLLYLGLRVLLCSTDKLVTAAGKPAPGIGVAEWGGA